MHPKACICLLILSKKTYIVRNKTVTNLSCAEAFLSRFISNLKVNPLVKRRSKLRGETLWSLHFSLGDLKYRNKKGKIEGKEMEVLSLPIVSTESYSKDGHKRQRGRKTSPMIMIISAKVHFAKTCCWQKLMSPCDKTSHYQNLLNRRLTIAAQKLLLTRSFT